ncbi:MAG: hypothetical protein U0Q16_21470 [Bryobacteraceae bacterium]
MTAKLDREQLAAELSALDNVLASVRPNDLLGRIGLESRRREIVRQLEELSGAVENRAKVALFFGGEPVVGSMGIQAGFGTKAVGSFQDLLSKVWSTVDGGALQPMGPIRDKDASTLHITNLVHGSFGFLLEEIDEGATEMMFETALKKAADQVADYITAFADENEATFSRVIEDVNPRVFLSIRDFFGYMHKGHATFRLVEGHRDEKFDHVAVERAWLRAEASKVDEDRITVKGKLLGIIPIGRRFEFEMDGSQQVTSGQIGEKFGQTYLERMSTQQFAGRRWRAVFHRKVIEKAGRMPVEKYTLLELEEITE